jgi:hypothetical protein
VRVPPGQSLTILPGVEVLFQGYYKLIVDTAATLRAVGTAVDSIRFDALFIDSTSWHGIGFLSASDSCRLEYCLLTHSAEDDNGGAIYTSNSNPTICRNTISESLAWVGGGIYCMDSSPVINGNIISGSSAFGGGGIACEGGSPIIIHNTIIGNAALPLFQPGGGGGIYCYHSNASIIGNIVCGNSAGAFYDDPGRGGGIYCYESNPVIRNNTIIGNSAGDGINCYNSSPTLVNCIVWGNNSPRQIYQWGSSNLQATYCDIQDMLWPGQGNISVDPGFVDSANGDYHLQSTEGSFHGGSWLRDLFDSPCIDAGDPSSPFDLEPAPNGGRINMGFEGNTPEASLTAGPQHPIIMPTGANAVLRWNAVPGEGIQYNIYCDSSPDGAFTQLLGTTTDTSLVDAATDVKKFYVVTAERP